MPTNEVQGRKNQGAKVKEKNTNSGKPGNYSNRNNSSANKNNGGNNSFANNGNFSGKRGKNQRTKNNYFSKPRHTISVREGETVDDIAADITRIEKEIQLEIKEIRSLKLGL